MSVKVAGVGTWIAGNNAALTPTVPTGGQAGDTVICIGYVRENGATLAISGSGTTWNLIGTHASPANEMRASVWYGAWASGMANPTVTPSGSGSNDTTLATCILLRGTIYSVTVLGSETVAQDDGRAQYSGNALVLGDSCLTVSFLSAAQTASYLYARSNNAIFVEETSSNPQRFWTANINSALGADSSAVWGFVELPAALDGTTDWLVMESVYSAFGASLEFRIKFNGDPPTDLPTIYAVDADINLVIGFDGSCGQPTFYRTDALIDLIVGWEGSVQGIELRRYSANVDLRVGGAMTFTKGPAPDPVLLYGISPAWDATYNPKTNTRDWTLDVLLDGVPIRAVSATIRRQLGAVALSVQAVGDVDAVVGALLSLNVTFMKGTAQETVVQTVSGYITQSSYRYPTTLLSADRTDQQTNGVVWTPSRLLYLSDTRIRSEVDWFVRPGDLSDGRTINEVVTVLGGNSWFTEVGCG